MLGQRLINWINQYRICISFTQIQLHSKIFLYLLIPIFPFFIPNFPVMSCLCRIQLSRRFWRWQKTQITYTVWQPYLPSTQCWMLQDLKSLEVSSYQLSSALLKIMSLMSDSMSQKLYRKSLPYLTHRKFVNEKKS